VSTIALDSSSSPACFAWSYNTLLTRAKIPCRRSLINFSSTEWVYGAVDPDAHSSCCFQRTYDCAKMINVILLPIKVSIISPFSFCNAYTSNWCARSPHLKPQYSTLTSGRQWVHQPNCMLQGRPSFSWFLRAFSIHHPPPPPPHPSLIAKQVHLTSTYAVLV
jgi:hypothetical protein